MDLNDGLAGALTFASGAALTLAWHCYVMWLEGNRSKILERMLRDSVSEIREENRTLREEIRGLLYPQPDEYDEPVTGRPWTDSILDPLYSGRVLTPEELYGPRNIRCLACNDVGCSRCKGGST